MSIVILEDIKIKLFKENKILGYQDISFVKCEYKNKEFSFFKKGNEEWNPFLGVLIDDKKTFDLGIITHKIIASKENEDTNYISCLLGGGRWITEKERGSFLNFEKIKPDNIYYHINNYINSKFMKYIKQHRNNFYYFTIQDIDYDDLESKDISFKKIKKLNNLEKLSIENTLYNNKSLLVFLSTSSTKENLKLLEEVFINDNSLSFKINFYINNYNKKLILRYKLINYYLTDIFKFKYLLQENIKKLTSVQLGKVKKITIKQIRGYNLIMKNVETITYEEINLIDVLLNMNIDFITEVVDKNKKLFIDKETKKYVKSKKTKTNNYLADYLLKLK